MTCQDIRDDIDLHALGTLDPDEARAVAAHIAGCAGCSAELRMAEAAAARLGLATPIVRAPAAMRAAVLGAVAAGPAPSPSPRRPVAIAAARPRGSWTERWTRRYGAIAAALMLLPLVGALLWGVRLQREIADLRQETAAIQRRSEGLTLFAVPSSIRADFKPVAENISASGAASWVPDRSACAVLFDALPPADAGTVYRLWYIVDGSRVIDAGIVVPDADGRATISIDTSRWRGQVYDMILRREQAGHLSDPDAPALLTARVSRVN